MVSGVLWYKRGNSDTNIHTNSRISLYFAGELFQRPSSSKKNEVQKERNNANGIFSSLQLEAFGVPLRCVSQPAAIDKF